MYEGDITTRLNEAIRESRYSRHADLARALGVSKQAVCEWTKGRAKNIRPEHLIQLAETLGVEAKWLAIGIGPKLRPSIDAEILATIEALSSLPEEPRRAFAAAIKYTRNLHPKDAA